MSNYNSKLRLSLTILCLWLGFSYAAAAQSVIRDAEIEGNLRMIANPIFDAAGLNPSQVRIILIDDDMVNAFVSTGQNLFLYTGLILETQNVAQLGGVIAHEAGHMAGGHLIRMRNAAERASLESMAATLAGVALGVGAGSPDVGMATAMGGSQYASRVFLRNSRAFESSADQAGMTTLSRMELSTQGMADFLEILSGQEALPELQRSGYVLTHPLSRERLDSVRAYTVRAASRDKPWPADWEEKFRVIQAKIMAFTQPARAERQFESQNNTVAFYTTAIAAYRQGRIAEALKKLDVLEKGEPQNPWYKDLRGQILFEQGRIDEAIAAYNKAVALSPQSGLLHYALAQALLQKNDAASARDAVTHLVSARERGERDNAMVYHWLAVANGRLGREGDAKLALAEKALLNGDYPFAIQQAKHAQNLLKNDKAGSQRARDLIAQAARLAKEKSEKD